MGRGARASSSFRLPAEASRSMFISRPRFRRFAVRLRGYAPAWRAGLVQLEPLVDADGCRPAVRAVYFVEPTHLLLDEREPDRVIAREVRHLECDPAFGRIFGRKRSRERRAPALCERRSRWPLE